MVDILLSLPDFLDFIKDRPVLNVFESRILVVCPVPTSNLTLLAYKDDPKPLFKEKRSVSFEGIGQMGLFMWEQPKAEQASEEDLTLLSVVRRKVGAMSDSGFKNLVALLTSEKERRDKIAALKVTRDALSRVT